MTDTYRLLKDISMPEYTIPQGTISIPDRDGDPEFISGDFSRYYTLDEINAHPDWFEKIEPVTRLTVDDESMFVVAYDSECDDKNLTLHVGNYNGNIQELYDHIKKILGLRLLK